MLHVRRFFIPIIAIFCFPGFAFAQATFQIDPKKSDISFSVSSTFDDFDGKAHKISGTIDIPGFPGDLASGASASILIDAKSLSTGHKGRDKHMHENVLESEKYPEIKLAVKKIVAESAAYSYQVTADLTLHGVTKTLTFKCAALEYKDGGKDALSISGKVKIDMTGWGITPPNIVVNKVSKDMIIRWTLVAFKS